MSDSRIVLNQGQGGKELDTEALQGGGGATVERQRIQVAGAALAEVARVVNDTPASDAYALVVRNIPSGTQAVSGPLTDAQLRATALPVSGTFWPGTQPVSGTVGISGTVPVSGTFWQATQPVSGSVTVSGTVTANVGTGTQPVSGHVGLGDSSAGKALVMRTGTLPTTAVTANQVVLTYTVTAAKTFFLTYLKWQARLTTFAATATRFGSISLEAPANTKLITEDIFHAGIDGCYTLTFPDPLFFAAGTVVRVVCTPSATTAFTWACSFGGYER